MQREAPELDIYFPPAFSKSSCDPNFTDASWPCRGTAACCSKQNCLPDGTPTNSSCWRYSFRHHQKVCKATGGFMIQINESTGLSAGQEIETEMAALEGLKIFVVQQG